LVDLQDGGQGLVGDEKSLLREGAKIAVEELYPAETELQTDGITVNEAPTPLWDTVFDSSSSEAQNSVLLTVELLELILSFLPSPDVWRARNVCHSWKELVMTSPSLRTSLWFTSTVPPQTPVRGKLSKETFTINPVLEALNLVKASQFTYYKLANVNFPARWRTVKAPWRELQICEPPIQRVFLNSSWLDKYLECETGITAGMLADKLELSRVGTLSSFHSA
jgi:hypothetical protein